jgi:hypothetical protein
LLVEKRQKRTLHWVEKKPKRFFFPMGLFSSKDSAASGPDSLVGNKAPDMQLFSVDGGYSTSLYELLKQGKPVILDIYAEWSGKPPAFTEDF